MSADARPIRDSLAIAATALLVVESPLPGMLFVPSSEPLTQLIETIPY